MESSPHIREAAHPTPRTYVTIATVLGIITAVEVGIFYIEAIEDVIIPMFFVLSAVKFALVAMFYMHLKFDERIFSVFFVGGLILAAGVILALMALFDVLLHTPSVAAVADGTDVTETEDTGVPEGSVTHEISTVSSDDLEFDNDTLTASAGTEVVLRFSNNAITQQHNWVLVQSGARDEIATAGVLAGPANDWVPEDDRVIANTKLISAGESGEVSFTAPEAGTYQFVCTFPGHNLTMFGTFEVSP